MSSTYSVFYCRKEPAGQFAEVDLSPESPEFDDKDLSTFSKDHGEVVYLAEQENVGFIHYEHWNRGALVRRLKYNDDYAWLSADGEPEPWEADALFTAENLSKTLQGYDPEMHEKIRETWNRKIIRTGDSFPVLGPVDIIRILRQYWKV
ncbi:MAG TPA: hypothetical protein PLU72_11795 [Candidatus Ozemobacteraceae bacterium]|nr:hypothetical protein [Candidatus Ozemobacteraceae bacterium]